MIRAASRFFAPFAAAILLGGCATDATIDESDPPEEILDKADSSLHRGLFSKAVERYQRLESLHPYSRQAVQAQIMAAYAYYQQGEAMAAEKAISRRAPVTRSVRRTQRAMRRLP